MEGGQSQGQHDAAFTWFTEQQRQAVIRNGIIPEWFHGIISRKTAEELLLSKPRGYFLIRVSESRIGYTLSYRAEDRCRHFMIDVLKDGHYVIVGENTQHWSLQDLVDFHRRTPILPFKEVLTVPCGQLSKDRTDYAELLFSQRPLPKPNVSPALNSSTQPNTKSHLKPEEDIPPALPHRPTTLSGPGVLSPNVTKTPTAPSSQPNTLYPCLQDELSHFTAQIPATPVPMPRKKYSANLAQQEQFPELPTRSSAPAQKLNQACTRANAPPEIPSSSRTTERLVTQPTRQEEDHPHNANSQSVVTNLKNLKKKFQRRRSSSEVHTYAEISVEAEERLRGRQGSLEARDTNENTENEYQELPGEHDINGVPFSSTSTAMKQALPQEYLPPPPFAPGY
ncbi:hematopoietic SH2 domain-containing protein homolog [Myripristis murdjan]|uniref:Hematopoietic SH2 domain containing n=1 Tax=Myripristis murdjan TaxID=586833 RepID=A0A667W7W1_9TELE|nr:hematopoietic SH2 domain-containing protein [Myripristis murdjan]XP_029905403.1 hematopoietic SH2 domain-containing protein [Myripristis murdjan]